MGNKLRWVPGVFLFGYLGYSLVRDAWNNFKMWRMMRRSAHVDTFLEDAEAEELLRTARLKQFVADGLRDAEAEQRRLMGGA